MESVNSVDSGPEVVSDEMMTELRECFLEAYDDNKDGKIEIREVKACVAIFFVSVFYRAYKFDLTCN